MNRVDRLFAILLFLQNRARVRSQDLAIHFGVSQRTIYRDMATLTEIGVPLMSLPGEGYELAEGYYLPPLMFSTDEASIILLSARLLARQATGKAVEHLEQALNKLRAVLPQQTIVHIDELTEIIQFGLPQSSFNLDDPRLVAFYRACKQQQLIWLQYHSLEHDEVTERTIEPEQIHYYRGAWYIHGYCRLRQAVRWFHFDRIDTYSVLTESFDKRQIEPPESTWIRVRVRFKAQILRWVRERQFHAFVEEEEASEAKHKVMVYQIRPGKLREIQRWIMSWGADAEVLHPSSLRASIRQEAQRIFAMLT